MAAVKLGDTPSTLPDAAYTATGTGSCHALGPTQLCPPTAQHAYLVHSTDYGPLMTPTELGHAFSTMTLPHPDDVWYMDSSATSHDTYFW